MDKYETQESVTAVIARAVAGGSVLAPHVARAVAEKAVAELLEAEYLITNGEIHLVVEADFRGEDASGESDVWYVYTHQTEDSELEDASEEELRERAGVDEDGAPYV